MRTIDTRYRPAVSGIDLEQSLNYIALADVSLDFIYDKYTSGKIIYTVGSRPVLEGLAVKLLGGITGEIEKIEKLTRFVAEEVPWAGYYHQAMGHRLAYNRNLDEEGLIASGYGWCNEQARLLCALTQIIGIPSRLVFASARKGGGHVVVEVLTCTGWLLADHIKGSAYADKIVGIAPTDGTTWEWMWNHGRGHHGRAYSGWSPADIEAYRHYLQNKYQTDAQLAAAWNQPGATLAKAMPPVPERLDSASVINMLDPSKDMDLIDFYIFRNETIANDIIAICRMIKENSDGNWIAGSYYGYLITFSHMYWHLQDGGHLRLSKVARSPYVDFVFGPTLYHWRRLGLAESPMQPAEAVSSHGKLDIGELDIRTFSEPSHHESINGKTNTVEQSVGAMNRSFCMLLTRGMGGHWMEMYETWYREPVILDLIKSQNDLYRSLPEKPVGTTPREVCIVSDEDSAFYVKNNMGDGIHNILVAEIMKTIPAAGFAFRHILLKDLLEPGVIPPQKLYIITNLMMLDKAARQTLIERFHKEKAQVIWLYAPGAFFPDQGPSAANIEQLLGLKFTMLDKKVALSMQMKTDRLGSSEVKNYIQTGPWFLPTSGYDELLATTPDGKPAMVSWQKDNVKNYFAAVPNLPPAMFRAIARQAGVWCYADGSDPVYVGNDLVAIHAKSGGKRSLNIPAGLKAKAVIGPLQGYFKSGQAWDAIPGLTYGFMLEKE